MVGEGNSVCVFPHNTTHCRWYGVVAKLANAPALHAGDWGFESLRLHTISSHYTVRKCIFGSLVQRKEHLFCNQEIGFESRSIHQSIIIWQVKILVFVGATRPCVRGDKLVDAPIVPTKGCIWHCSPIGRGNGLKSQSVWVRIPSVLQIIWRFQTNIRQWQSGWMQQSPKLSPKGHMGSNPIWRANETVKQSQVRTTVIAYLQSKHDTTEGRSVPKSNIS